MEKTHEPRLFPVAARPDGLGAFESWLQMASTRARDPLSREAAQPYGHIWQSWLRSLQPHQGAQGAVEGVQWHEATPLHVLAFLDADRAGRRDGTKVTEVTRRRYWTVLGWVYAHALRQGWIEVNPAEELTEKETPPRENHLAVVLSPSMWRTSFDCLPSSFDGTVAATRNRAVLLALLHLGLTPQEVRNLKTRDVLRETTASGALGGIRALQLDGTGPRQRRRLQVPPDLADALGQWVIARESYLRTRSATGKRPQEWLFCSNREGPLTPNALLHLVKMHLQAVAQRCNDGVLPPRAGPQVIRNTRLTLWLNDGVPPAEVAVRAGLKNLKGLYHLREAVNPGVRLTLGHGRDDEDLWERLQPQV